MARIRYIKPGFFQDEDVADLKHWVRLLYIGLWPIADKEGRLEDRPRRIKAEIFPYEEVNVEEGLAILTQPKKGSGDPFIKRYEIDGRKYIQILKWKEHQRPHHTEHPSKIPFISPLKGKENGEGNGEPARNELEVKEQSFNGERTVIQSKKNEIVDFWNSKEVLPKIKDFSDSRKERLNARLKSPFFVENWRAAIQKLTETDFCLGQKGWKADFEWFIRDDDSVAKIMEGKYDDHRSALTKMFEKEGIFED